MSQRPIDPAAIEAEIDRVRSLGLDALRQRWRGVFGSTPPRALTKDILVRMIAYRIQEERFGGLDRETVKLLGRLGRGDRAGAELNRRLKPGAVLIREYQGERHTVTVVPDGFVWQDVTWPSLSTIARAITGTTWSGPRFFGVRTSAEPEQQGSRERSASNGSAPARRRGPPPVSGKAPHREAQR